MFFKFDIFFFTSKTNHMKNLVKILVVSIIFALTTSNVFGRVVGTIVNGVPIVTLSNYDLQQQINELGAFGFTNLTLVEMHLTFTPGAPSSGYFIYTFTFLPPNSNIPRKGMISAKCDYNSGNNEFVVATPSGGWACISQNCLDCCPQENDCTACNTEDSNKSSKCERQVDGESWGEDLEGVITDIRAWLQE